MATLRINRDDWDRFCMAHFGAEDADANSDADTGAEVTLAAVLAAFDDLVATRDALRVERDTLGKQLRTTQQELVVTHERVEKLTRHPETLRSTLQHQLDELRTKLQMLTSQNQTLREQLDRARSSDTGDETVVVYKDPPELAALREKRDTLQARCWELQAELKEVQDDRERLTQQVELREEGRAAAYALLLYHAAGTDADRVEDDTLTPPTSAAMDHRAVVLSKSEYDAFNRNRRGFLDDLGVEGSGCVIPLTRLTADQVVCQPFEGWGPDRVHRSHSHRTGRGRSTGADLHGRHRTELEKLKGIQVLYDELYEKYQLLELKYEQLKASPKVVEKIVYRDRDRDAAERIAELEAEVEALRAKLGTAGASKSGGGTANSTTSTGGGEGGGGTGKKKKRVRTGDILTAQIVDTGKEGDGVAKIGDYVVFVPETKPGDRVELVVTRTMRSFGFGEALRHLDRSGATGKQGSKGAKRTRGGKRGGGRGRGRGRRGRKRGGKRKGGGGNRARGKRSTGNGKQPGGKPGDGGGAAGKDRTSSG